MKKFYLIIILVILSCGLSACTWIETNLLSQNEESYIEAYNSYQLMLRDENYEEIEMIPPHSDFKVYRLSGEYEGRVRVEVEVNGLRGTVVADGLVDKTSGKVVAEVLADISHNTETFTHSETQTNIEKEELKEESYWAVANVALNFKDENGNVIEEIDANAGMKVIRISTKDSSQAIVEWQGRQGSVTKKYLTKINNGIFINRRYQKITMILNGQIICLGDCVTGMKGVSETRPGVFKIKYLQHWANLNLNGEGEGLDVEFWMPFDGHIGIHNNPNRSEFGGNIYTYNGSGGCVNTPYEVAKKIFDNAYVAMPVYVA